MSVAGRRYWLWMTVNTGDGQETASWESWGHWDLHVYERKCRHRHRAGRNEKPAKRNYPVQSSRTSLIKTLTFISLPWLNQENLSSVQSISELVPPTPTLGEVLASFRVLFLILVLVCADPLARMPFLASCCLFSRLTYPWRFILGIGTLGNPSLSAHSLSQSYWM